MIDIHRNDFYKFDTKNRAKRFNFPEKVKIYL
jgi:hypothetical protein